MSLSPNSLADAALELLGKPFRLHGRVPATGLDCVGLVSAALAATGARPIVPTGYTLRNLDVDHWLPMAGASGLVTACGPVRAGDILLVVLPHCQHHLMIAADAENAVHAHAGLRRVVRQPIDPDWQIRARWRAAPISEG